MYKVSKFATQIAYVLHDQPSYDSHCLNKDIPALLHMAHGKAPLISEMHRINISRKERFYENT